MVQRRVVHRRYFLKPTKRTAETFGYCLAHAAAKTGVLIHEFNVLSNHYHVVLTDPNAQLPKFEQILNSFVARSLNASYGRFGTFWERESFSAPELPEEADLIDKCVYVLANPCSAHLVERARDWPGLCSWPLEYGEKRVFSRPLPFGDDMPETLDLVLVRPPVRLDLDPRELRAEIRRRCIEREQELAKKRRTCGHPVVGLEVVMRQDIDASPLTRPARSGPRPTVSTRSIWARVAAIQRNKEWLQHYREALASYLAGIRDAVFPFGTYLMKVRFSVACAGP
jgi:putative transposase